MPLPYFRIYAACIICSTTVWNFACDIIDKARECVVDLKSLYSEIVEATKVDAELSILCHRAAEYARLHLYMRKTSGCNSLGEIEHLLDEFRKKIYEIIRYCGKKGHVDNTAIYTIEMTDEELTRLGDELGEFL